MSDVTAAALIAVGGTLGGVVVTLVGTAVIERVKRTASRRDAAAERQVAVLRELQDVVIDFAREWSELIAAIDRGEAQYKGLTISSGPTVAALRFAILMERVTDYRLRTALNEFSTKLMKRAENGSDAPSNQALADQLAEVHGHIGRVLRSLSP
jgi:hypothetical protein